MLSRVKQLQTELEKHYAAPRNRKEFKFFKPSPFIVKPEVGLVVKYLPSALNMIKFQFRPNEHRVYERREVEMNKLRKEKHEKDMQVINMIFPIELLHRAIQELVAKMPKLPDPIPIRIKQSPQMSRVKNLRRRTKRKTRSRIMKKPERGQLIPPTIKYLTIDQIIMQYPQPKLITYKLFTSLLGFQNGMLPAREFLGQFIAQQRAVLYQEEGAKWVKIFHPQFTDDDPAIASIYRVFDNTDDGIPGPCFSLKEGTSAVSVYRFRVLTKRCLMKPLPDEEEIYLFSEILGLTRAEINQFIIRFLLLEQVHGNFHQEFHDMVYNVLKNACAMEVKKEIKEEPETYEEAMVPILKELLQ
ncbi:hypothetical protein CAEBREN_17809 [Caenorhabditis brenneri]|uniref:Uncharacterized protein n=1 Tax=Caenorhabditis brenneri TaxID=135651 RepID=G0NPS1_CAEBE|nr:hypothetical protein CAEBREN_17809 [Caenorhabditis brenneri]